MRKKVLSFAAMFLFALIITLAFPATASADYRELTPMKYELMMPEPFSEGLARVRVDGT